VSAPPNTGRRVLAAALAGILAGCAAAPAYRTPEVEVPAHFSTSAGGSGAWDVAAPADTAPRGEWWRLFHDPALDQLEQQLVLSNQNLKQAAAQWQQARALENVARAGFYPTVGADVGATRARTSANVEGRSLAGQTVNDFSTGLVASWEPDLFGRVASATDAAHADAQASAADLEGVRLAMTSELAFDYFGLRAVDAEISLLDASVRAYGESLQMVESQRRLGAVDDAAVAQAQTQLEGARSQAEELGIQRRRYVHAIATLTGKPAPGFELAPEAVAPTPALTSTPTLQQMPAVPPGLPSQLLQRRPDVAAAERRVASANARIGQARAAFFPSLVLSAAAGLESSTFAPWLGAPSLFWALGPQLVGTLFDGGQRKAQLAGANAAYDAEVASYRQTVLAAFQDVEDELSALQGLAQEAQSEQRATEAAERSLALTSNRYRAGTASYLDVTTTQTLALDHERTLAQVQGRRMQASVLLLKAIGGGWQGLPDVAPLPAAAAIARETPG